MKLVRNLGHHDKQTRDIPYNTHRDTAIRELGINHHAHSKATGRALGIYLASHKPKLYPERHN